MLIHVSLKKNEVILNVYVTFSRLIKHFEVSFRVRPSSGIKSRGNIIWSHGITAHPPGNFFATYRMCYLIPDYYPRILFHIFNEL